MSNVGIVSTIPRGTRIGPTEWQLGLALTVEFQQTDKYVIATNSWIDEYGHGLTRAEAVADLLTSLLDLYQSLRQQQRDSQLADELLQTLAKLDSLLVKGS